MRKNQDQQVWNISVVIRFLAIPAILAILVYLGKKSLDTQKKY